MPLRMMTNKVPMFFKFMLPNFSEKLCLPPAFLKHLKMEKCDTVILKSALGISWEVEASRSDKELWLGKGWRDFVQGHNLQLGECLVFCFDGDMVFHVTIFDTSCCEKKLLLGKKDGERKRVEKSPVMNMKKGQMPRDLKDEELTTVATKKAKKQVYRGCSAVKSEIWPSYKCDNPHFMLRLVPSNFSINPYLHIPASFRKVENMSQIKNLILVDPCGRSWPVKVCHRERGDIIISTGWIHFQKNNALKVGDICSFEFVDGRKKIMNVQIMGR